MTPNDLSHAAEVLMAAIRIRYVGPAVRLSENATYKEISQEAVLSHCLFLLGKVHNLAHSPNTIGKANRWLAWSQGLLWTTGIFPSIQDLKEINDSKDSRQISFEFD